MNARNRPAVERRWFNGREFRRATWHDGGPGGTVILVHVIREHRSASVFTGTLTARRVI